MFMQTLWKQGALILLFITAVPALPTRPILKHHEPLEPSVRDDVGGGKDLTKRCASSSRRSTCSSDEQFNERYDYFYMVDARAQDRFQGVRSSRAIVVHYSMERGRSPTRMVKRARTKS